MPNKEQDQEGQEPEETQGDDVRKELDAASPAEGETSEAETAEDKTKSEEGEKDKGKEDKEGQETFEEKLDRLAQSKKDKELKPLYKERDELKTENAKLKEQLNDKTWDRTLQGLFNEDVEKLGEDEANKRKADREKVAAQVKEYHQKNTDVEKAKRFYDEQLPKLGMIERNQKAREEVWKIVFSDDKAKLEQANVLVKKFEKAQDMDDFDIILESIKESHKAKSKPFIPDSGKGAGSGKKKGRKPTLDELRASHPDETDKKIKSGEWIL